MYIKRIVKTEKVYYILCVYDKQSCKWVETFISLSIASALACDGKVKIVDINSYN